MSGRNVQNMTNPMIQQHARELDLAAEQRDFGDTPEGGAVALFDVQSIADEWVVCKKVISIDSTGAVTTETTTTKVALPQMLRKSYWNGKTDVAGVTYSQPGSTHTREGDNGSTTEDQTIQPPYILFSGYANLILARRDVEGGTGAFDGDVELQWLDVNDAGRMWFGE